MAMARGRRTFGRPGFFGIPFRPPLLRTPCGGLWQTPRALAWRKAGQRPVRTVQRAPVPECASASYSWWSATACSQRSLIACGMADAIARMAGLSYTCTAAQHVTSLRPCDSPGPMLQ